MTNDPQVLDDDVLDLDADRQSRAAAREGRNKPMRIKFGGEFIATLPVELPIDTLAPLRDIDEDLVLMLRAVMQAARAAGRPESAMDATMLIVDLIAANPQMPTTFLDTIKRVAVNLLSEDGFNRYMSQRPSREDMAALVKGVFRFYGVSLGESSAPSDSQADGGATSNTTSSTNSGSTPAASTPTPADPQTPETPPTSDGQQPLAS